MSSTPASAARQTNRPAPRPNVEAYPDAPCILLGDESWPIPRLVPRQNRIIEPRLMPLLRTLYPEFEKVQRSIAAGEAPSTDFKVMSEEQYDSALRVVAAALTRAHPDFRLDDLLDMEGVTAPQLVVALTVVTQATGLYKRKPEGAKGEPAAGETKAEASPSTGTVSSPEPVDTSVAPQITGKTP